jgi:hypothetical protein
MDPSFIEKVEEIADEMNVAIKVAPAPLRAQQNTSPSSL